jgi:hypothetical protein
VELIVEQGKLKQKNGERNMSKELIEARRELKRIRNAVDTVRINQPMKGTGHGPLAKQFQYNLLYANNFLKTAIEQINEVIELCQAKES